MSCGCKGCGGRGSRCKYGNSVPPEPSFEDDAPSALQFIAPHMQDKLQDTAPAVDSQEACPTAGSMHVLNGFDGIGYRSQSSLSLKQRPLPAEPFIRSNLRKLNS